ncbi:MAG: hypothetical protein MHM6MM_007107 [Cercozoa sp. M6MM]
MGLGAAPTGRYRRARAKQEEASQTRVSQCPYACVLNRGAKRRATKEARAKRAREEIETALQYRQELLDSGKVTELQLEQFDGFRAARTRLRRCSKDKRRAATDRVLSGEEFQHRVFNDQVLPQLHEDSSSVGVPHVVLDCIFDDEMREQECDGLARQLRECNNIMRASTVPVRVHVTSWSKSPRTRKFAETSQGFDSWHLEYHDENLERLTCLPKKVVYLTAEASEDLSPDDIREWRTGKSAMVIGGLLDHNRLKNRTHTRATSDFKHSAFEVVTRRLPLPRYITLPDQRQVITVNQVVHMLQLLHAMLHQPVIGDGDRIDMAWRVAMTAMPKRNGATLHSPLTQAEKWMHEDCLVNTEMPHLDPFLERFQNDPNFAQRAEAIRAAWQEARTKVSVAASSESSEEKVNSNADDDEAESAEPPAKRAKVMATNDVSPE